MKLLRKIFSRKKKSIITVPAGNFVELPPNANGRTSLRISGVGNRVKIGTLKPDSGGIAINIAGNNNTIEIGDNFFTSSGFNILIGHLADNYGPCNNASVKIGNWAKIEGAWISTFNSGSIVEIGDECMFSNEVILMQTDAHPIFDESGKITNFAGKMSIGNHVWLGTRVAVFKNSVIPEGAIVGGGAVVAGKFDEPNCILAGNPARVVRHSIRWTDYAREYCRNGIDPAPKILPCYDTIERIKSGASIARFGDGEFAHIIGAESLQRASAELSVQLRRVFNSNDGNFLIGICKFWWGSLLDMRDPDIRDYTQKWIRDNLPQIESMLDYGKQYASSEFSCLGAYSTADMKSHFSHIREIWDGKDIAIIAGQGLHKSYKFNIFDNAKSVEQIDAPRRNAFDSYDEIFARAKQISKSKMIFISLGPTADILAYDLFSLGYQAIDFGHAPKDYNAFMSGRGRQLQKFLRRGVIR